MKTKFNGILTLLLALVVQISFAQERTISGTVSDNTGGLPGVSVIIKGTTTGTETDFNGQFSIKAKTGDILSFSFLGYKTVEKTIGSSNTINVTMVEDANVLDEVVVTALGVKREAKALGYAQQSVKGDALTQTKETDLATAVAGKVSGVQFTGQPTSTFKAANIRLRGNTGLLYVVDGIKLNARTDVNNDDIETLTVLKGLAATVLYGPEGRNGAVVITTKRAKKGQTTINFNSSYNTTNVYVMPEYQDIYGGGYANDNKTAADADRYKSAIGKFEVFAFNPAIHPASWNSFNGQLIPHYGSDESWGPKLEGQMVRHWDSWIPNDPEFGKLRPWTANPDNVRDFYQTGYLSNQSLNFEKGGEDYSIRTGITRIDQELILENTKREFNIFTITADYKLSKKLKFNTSINYTNRNTFNDPTNGYGNLGSNFNQWWQRQIDINRLRNYKRNGQAVSWNISSPTNSRPAYWNSPFFVVYENTNEQDKNAIYGQVALTYDYNDKISASLAYKKSYSDYDYNSRVGWGGLEQEDYSEGTWTDNREEIFGRVTYVDDFGDFDLNASAGFEYTKIDYSAMSGSAVGGLTTQGFYSLGSSKDRPSISNSVGHQKSRAWFTTASVGYKNLAYLEGSLRMDYSSTANPDNNSVTTYGLSGSLLISQLLDNKDVINYAKIRAGYTSAPYFPGRYLLSNTYEIGTPYGSTGTSAVPNAAVNKELKGGTRDEIEFGTELKFLSNRIGLDVTYFQRKDNELPSWVSLPGTTGNSGFYSNQGKETYSGVEISLNVVPFKTEDMRWDLTFNAATLKRTVDYIADGVNTNVLSSWGPRLEKRVGKEWGAIYGNAYKRDDKGNKVLGTNGRYEFEQNKFLGNILPDFTGGITSNFSYKNLTFTLGFDYQVGGKFYGVTRRYGNFAGLGKETVGPNALGNPVRSAVAAIDPSDTGSSSITAVRYDKAAPNSGGQLTTGVDASGNPVQFLVNPYYLWRSNLRNIHEEYVNDATYLKLRTVSVGYKLPKSVVDKTPFTKIDLGLFANNVWLIYSDIDGVDPSETEGRSGYNWIENGQLPSARSIGFSAKFSF